MDTCLICGEDQDFKIYKGYNICTTCADIMEDVMGEYFLHVIRQSSHPKAHKGYFKYLSSSSQYISDYKKLTATSHKYTTDTSQRVADAVERSNSSSHKRYFERMQAVLDWLGNNPEFFHYYFKEYYTCPDCGASVFDTYEKHEIGEWIVISCSKCGTVIKKYFSPKRV